MESHIKLAEQAVTFLNHHLPHLGIRYEMDHIGTETYSPWDRIPPSTQTALEDTCEDACVYLSRLFRNAIQVADPRNGSSTQAEEETANAVPNEPDETHEEPELAPV